MLSLSPIDLFLEKIEESSPQQVNNSSLLESNSKQPVENIDVGLNIHDRFHIELKAHSRWSGIDSLKAEGEGYSIDAFFFFPPSFGINRNSYPVQQFFADAKNSLRREAPSLWRNNRVDNSNLDKQIKSLQQSFLQNEFPTGSDINALIFYGCSLRRTINEVKQPLELKSLNWETVLSQRLKSLCEELELLRGFREELLNRKLQNTQDYSEAALIIDEASSYQLEAVLAELEHRIKVQSKGEQKDTLSHLLVSILDKEMRYRNDNGFCIHQEEDLGEEYFTYRRGQLKKAMDQVLYFEREEVSTPTEVQHAIGGVGAALAASFAFTVQMGPQGLWSISEVSSFLLFVIAVSGYILKDRIKDITKTRLNRWLRGRTPDRLGIFQASSRGDGCPSISGNVQESVKFCALDDLPNKVCELRDHAHIVDILEDRREEVLHYSKLLGGTLSRKEETFEVKDLFRLNVHKFLEHLDASKRKVRYFDALTHRFSEGFVPKVYHLNIVLIYRENGGQEFSQRSRVVLSREGIIRIDDVCPAKKI